jgi:hypothetical protein
MMKLAVWLSLLGIIIVIAGGALLLRDLNHLRPTSNSPYILLVGAALIFVPWAAVGLQVFITILGTYFK